MQRYRCIRSGALKNRKRLKDSYSEYQGKNSEPSAVSALRAHSVVTYRLPTKNNRAHRSFLSDAPQSIFVSLLSSSAFGTFHHSSNTTGLNPFSRHSFTSRGPI